MAKKKAVEVVAVGVQGSMGITPKNLVTPVTHDFGRTDLNEMRDKLNALIEAVNNSSDA